uniref:CaM kinase-like vesicle-associated a n=1 Tax=Astyanax mexicanus TaxID=7994 RepID=A0A8B9H201_ASTMX
MPFGCLTLGEKKDYNSPTEVTDKYDLGQVVKSILRLCEQKDLKGSCATGREVFDWILDQGYYSERDTSNVIRQVLEAVAYLHSLRIVHRNLKLENLVYYNRLKHSKIVISDFHLARLENGLIKKPCGTPEYLAPEVVGRQRYGRPVDCWAIGVVMYILLSGNPPFYDDADDDDYDSHDKNLFRKILQGDYEFDSPYWDDISDSAKSLVASLMEVEQDQRLTAQEAINHECYPKAVCKSGGGEHDARILQISMCFIQKAVRVTTLMKRLRAPDQSDSGASSPAIGTSAGPVTPSGTSVPLAATPEPPHGTAEVKPEEAAAPARCNGEVPQLSVEPREEQNG